MMAEISGGYLMKTFTLLLAATLLATPADKPAPAARKHFEAF